MTNSSSDGLFADALKAKAAIATAETEAANKEPVAVAAPATQDAPQAQTQDDDDDAAIQQPTELDMLKSRARLMGVQFGNNIGVDALKAKIKAKLDGETAAEEAAAQTDQVQAQAQAQAQAQSQDQDPALVTEAVSAIATPAKKQSLRQQQVAEQMKLVRVRITNLDPKKKDLPGEIITFSNRILGTVKKYIPFGEATDNGYHIPQCIYEILKTREFLHIRTKVDSQGREVPETRMAREFSIEVLPQLTPEELAKLAASQAAGRNAD